MISMHRNGGLIGRLNHSAGILAEEESKGSLRRSLELETAHNERAAKQGMVQMLSWKPPILTKRLLQELREKHNVRS